MQKEKDAELTAAYFPDIHGVRFIANVKPMEHEYRKDIGNMKGSADVLYGRRFFHGSFLS